MPRSIRTRAEVAAESAKYETYLADREKGLIELQSTGGGEVPAEPAPADSRADRLAHDRRHSWRAIDRRA